MKTKRMKMKRIRRLGSESEDALRENKERKKLSFLFKITHSSAFGLRKGMISWWPIVMKTNSMAWRTLWMTTFLRTFWFSEVKPIRLTPSANKTAMIRYDVLPPQPIIYLSPPSASSAPFRCLKRPQRSIAHNLCTTSSSPFWLQVSPPY